MELKDTAPMMESPDYKERFKAEYIQLDIRIKKLTNMLARWRSGSLDFEPSCPYHILSAQLHAMMAYANLLEERARIEEVEL